MSALAAGLVLASCVLHAFWNLLLKRAGNKLAFTALYLAAAAVLYLPLLVYEGRRTSIPAAGWACVVGTAAVYFAYFVGLAYAYQHGELSVAYPLSRGLGPAFAVLTGMWVLAERPTPTGALGVSLVVTGVGALHWPGLGKGGLPTLGRELASRGSLAALFVAATYAAYSVIDKVAVARVGVSPPLYICLAYAVTACLVVPWVARREGPAALAAEWRARWPACLAVGGLNIFAYLLVLCAMALPGTPVSYVAPLRAASVLIGVFLGVGVLHEGRLAPKLGAALLMGAGIALIVWKG